MLAYSSYQAARSGMQEGLACAFESMRLFEEALLQYDELEAVLAQHVQVTKILKWFPETILEKPDMSLLQLPAKPYRDLIHTNQITGTGCIAAVYFLEERRTPELLRLECAQGRGYSHCTLFSSSVFDMQRYIFSRQCRLLFAMDKPLAGTRRALAFINHFARSVSTHQVFIKIGVFLASVLVDFRTTGAIILSRPLGIYRVSHC